MNRHIFMGIVIYTGVGVMLAALASGFSLLTWVAIAWIVLFILAVAIKIRVRKDR